jgi:predicted ester cyclase
MEDRYVGQSPKLIQAAVSRRSALHRLGAASLAAGIGLGAAEGAVNAQSSLATAATEAAARRAVSAINQALASGDTNVLDAAFASDYVNHTPHHSLLSGQSLSPDLAGLKSGVTELRTIAPDAVILIDDIVASGDTAAVRATFRGTLDTSIVSLPEGADTRLRIGGAAFARFVDGQVVESWVYDESAELYDSATPALPTETPVPDDASGATRDVSDFSRVSLQGVGTLVIEQSDTEALTIDAEPRVLRRIETTVQDGTLFIRPDRGFKTREAITYSLTVDELTGIELSGAGQVQMQRLETGDFSLIVSGAGSVAIEDLTAKTLAVEATGNASVTLGGTVDSQTVTFGQAGTYDAANLVSRIATVSVDGAAKAIVNASESLEASASGASSIAYYGDPSVSESTSGVGSVTPAG